MPFDRYKKKTQRVLFFDINSQDPYHGKCMYEESYIW